MARLLARILPRGHGMSNLDVDELQFRRKNRLQVLSSFLCPHSSARFFSAARKEHWQRNGGRGIGTRIRTGSSEVPRRPAVDPSPFSLLRDVGRAGEGSRSAVRRTTGGVGAEKRRQAAALQSGRSARGETRTYGRAFHLRTATFRTQKHAPGSLFIPLPPFLCQILLCRSERALAEEWGQRNRNPNPDRIFRASPTPCRRSEPVFAASGRWKGGRGIAVRRAADDRWSRSGKAASSRRTPKRTRRPQKRRKAASSRRTPKRAKRPR
jgi:hypothetical protein